MGTTPLQAIQARLDTLLSHAPIPDYPNALNGLQCANAGVVSRIAAAVDFSRAVIEECVRRQADFLFVHHGMFWGGLEPLTGTSYERVRLLLAHDIAVYSSHLPLDAHPDVGNNVLLARELGLEPSRPFARFQGVPIGVAGDSDIDTRELLEHADRYSRAWGGRALSSAVPVGHRTMRWGMCTGAGASDETLKEARVNNLDTLIVGEGPHHTAVSAPEWGVVLIYVGHYASETPGVRAVASRLTSEFGVESSFIDVPTGL